MEFDFIKKVRREGRLKKLTIPQDSSIKEGDFVYVLKVEGQREVTSKLGNETTKKKPVKFGEASNESRH